MSQKHLKKWYIREEAEDFALYGTDDKNKLIKAEAPYMVVNPAGIGIVYSNNGEFTVDIMDMAIRLFDPNGFSCVPVCGLRMYANAADPSYCGDPFRRNSAALPGFSASAIADAIPVRMWYVKGKPGNLTFYGILECQKEDAVVLKNPSVVCNSAGKMAVAKGKRLCTCWIDDIMDVFCDTVVWEWMPPECVELWYWKKEEMKVFMRVCEGNGKIIWLKNRRKQEGGAR